MGKGVLFLAIACLFFAVSPVHGAKNSTDSNKVDPDEDKALLVGLKNSGSGMASATYAILGLALATNVDASTLLWHAQWVTFAPWLEGYGGNSSIIWTSTTPPTGSNPDGVVFKFEEWTSHFWPLALNITWTENLGLVDSVAGGFESCTNSGADVEALNKSISNGTENASSTGGVTRRRHLVKLHHCLFEDRRHVKRAATFINVSITYVVGICVAALIQGIAWFASKGRWESYLTGSFWIQELDDLDKTNPCTFFHVALRAPRLFIAYFTYISWQPLVFASANAIATGSSTFVALGLVTLVLFVLVPLGTIHHLTTKHVRGKADQRQDENHKVVYVKLYRGWRDIENKSYNSWRKSTYVAGYGLLFQSYKGKWRSWLQIWLSLQLIICLLIARMIPLSAKIQAVVIMAVYVMYFISVLFMRPFISNVSWIMHILMCVHNFVDTVFTQFTDDDGLFNTDFGGDLASKGVQGATENDGILITMGFVGFITLYVYICGKIVYKVSQSFTKSKKKSDEDIREFSHHGKSNKSLSLSRSGQALNARENSWGNQGSSGMLADILNLQNAGESNVEMNPMKKSERVESRPDAQPKRVQPGKTSHTSSVGDTDPKGKAEAGKSPASSPEPLPDGWQAAKDPSTGREYFVNKHTSISQWTRPTAATSSVPSALPDGWQEVNDPSTGKKYFYNHRTSATQWHRPT